MCCCSIWRWTRGGPRLSALLQELISWLAPADELQTQGACTAQAAWGPDYGEETENLRVVINQLRKKIESNPTDPTYILTEPWVGYRFQVPRSKPAKVAVRK